MNESWEEKLEISVLQLSTDSRIDGKRQMNGKNWESCIGKDKLSL